MKKLLTIFIFLCLTRVAFAQFSLQYTNTRQAPANHNFTILDQVSDNSGNIYFVYSDDPAKYHLVSKVNAAGSTVWTDTLNVPGFPQVNVITAKINISQTKLYILFAGYGQPGPAGPIVAIYDFNGNFINGFNASPFSNVWTYGVHGVHEKANGNILVYYSYGDQFTANDTMYVKEFNPNFSLQWQLKFYVPKMTWFCPNTLTNTGDFYFSYSNDSVAGAQHFLNSFTRKVDNNGNVVWTNTYYDMVTRFLKKMPNGDIALAGNNNPSGSINGNNTGDLRIARLNDANGDTVWTRQYNGVNNVREEVMGIETDPLNNIYVAGTEDIRDYAPFVNKAFLQLYTNTGMLQYDKKLPALSASVGVYLDALSNLNFVSVTGGTIIHIKKVMSTNGNTLDSISHTAGFPMGMTATSSNTDDDVFFTYSEAHCGGNHLEVKRFCTKAICSNPTGTNLFDDEAQTLLYPNPAMGRLMIQTKQQLLNAEVYSLTGVKANLSLKNDQLDVSTLSPGVWLLQIKTTKAIHTFRFVKE